MVFYCILLAAGFSRRFGANKLLTPYQGKALYLHVLDRLMLLQERQDVERLIVVTRYPEIEEEMRRRQIAVVINENSQRGISSSLQRGITALSEQRPLAKDSALVFFVADQPGLRLSSMQGFLDAYAEKPSGILCMRAGETAGNPVIFSAAYIRELMALSGDVGGRQIFHRHPEDVRYFEVEAQELTDVDRP